ncbi:hypothetical protein [Sinanaerobacter chloroacetimidivorans]|uniref:Uncharacterized protein n=1 Tax=Sinanaerobacter chloroacetimidivorans TaxID=2818044 RepID=A0A8J8B0Y0_9FIRM|nr:hypothetical protein [Sinanaerobacter chloroacetimidivorans]MBR0598103.1 hypothetical protein [Sinanaerobacter chloroacetimidivorans]
MTKQKRDQYTEMINRREITIEMLINCIANLEPLISKSAYEMKKYKYALSDNSEYYFKRYIGFRNIIMKILNSPPLEEIREIIKGYKKSDIVSNVMRDQIMELIISKDFTLVE